jgi:flagellar FliL protein
MTGAASATVDAVAADEKPKKGGKKKLILLAVPLLLGAIGGGLWLTGILPRMLGLSHPSAAEVAKAEARKEAEKALPVFLQLPEMVANLNSTARKQSYVKLNAKLQLAKEDDIKTVTADMPRLLDLFQTYLREMRPEELRGSAGIYRLREELIARARIAVAPVTVVDILFTDLLVQ